MPPSPSANLAPEASKTPVVSRSAHTKSAEVPFHPCIRLLLDPVRSTTPTSLAPEPRRCWLSAGCQVVQLEPFQRNK